MIKPCRHQWSVWRPPLDNHGSARVSRRWCHICDGVEELNLYPVPHVCAGRCFDPDNPCEIGQAMAGI